MLSGGFLKHFLVSAVVTLLVIALYNHFSGQTVAQLWSKSGT